MSRKKQKPPIRYFTFSPEMVHVTQEAMKLLTPLLARAEGQPEKVAFAKETVQQVRSKLDSMRTSVGVMCLTSFDYNQKLVIATAIQLYRGELLATSASSQRERELKRCQQIMRFALDPGKEPGR